MIGEASHPGCHRDGCTSDAVMKIIDDDRLTDQFVCAEHAADYLLASYLSNSGSHA